MSITIPQRALIEKRTQYSLDISAAVGGLPTERKEWATMRTILSQVQDSSNRIEKALRDATDNTFDEIIVRDRSGVLIGWIGSRAPYFGAWFKQVYIGEDGPDTAPFFADVDGNVIIGKNGSLAIQDSGQNEVGWLGVQSDASKAITGATNATPIVVTSAAHGYENGDTVFIAGVLGNTAANGYRIVHAVTANTYALTTLAGANVAGNGAYTSGGTAIRYFGGGRFQTIAVGESFTNYKLRAYADGQLKIKDALITLTDVANDGYIEINPNGPVALFRNTLTGIQTRIEEGFITLENYITPAENMVLSYTGLTLYNSSNDPNVFLSAAFGGHGFVAVYDNSGSQTVGLTGSTGTVGCEILSASTYVDTALYKVGGVSGVDSGPTNYGISLNVGTGSAITSVDFVTPATTSGTFVTSVTLNTVSRQFTKGILTT